MLALNTCGLLRGRVGPNQNGVAVRRAPGGSLDADRAVGAGLVLDIDLLTERNATGGSADHTGGDVGRSAGRETAR